MSFDHQIKYDRPLPGLLEAITVRNHVRAVRQEGPLVVVGRSLSADRAKYQNRIKEPTKIANKHRKRYSTSFVIKEMLIKTTIRYH